jgi:hypothetical protein
MTDQEPTVADWDSYFIDRDLTQWQSRADEHQDDCRERHGFGVCARGTCVEPCGPNGGCIR